MHFRNEQVAKELMKALSKVLREEIAQERYGLVTVSDIVVTRGLEQAKVFISTMRHGRTLVKELNRKARHFTQAIHREVNLRKIPVLTFEYDISTERVAKMDELMQQDKQLSPNKGEEEK